MLKEPQWKAHPAHVSLSFGSASVDPLESLHDPAHPYFVREEILELQNVDIIGDSFLIRGGKLITEEAVYPAYLKLGAESVGYKKRLQRQRSSAKESMNLNSVFVFSHPHARYYGHFLTECLPRLFIIKDLIDTHPEVPVYIGPREPKFIKNYLKLLIPNARLVDLAEHQWVRARTAIVPNIQYYWYSKELRQKLQDFACNVAGVMGSGANDRLLVSRSLIDSLSSPRKLMNFEQLADIAISKGYVIYHPQQQSVANQITAFFRANRIVGEYGSAMHNAIFSPPQTVVFCLNRINHVQQCIGANFGHRNFFLLPEREKRSFNFLQHQTKKGVKFWINARLFEDALCEIENHS